ncbi:MAG TPA: hypothetical protein VFV05_18605 [Methylomirabilota bacterium]|nr:hypothetical protein [Methylomirabilota bacterium]
MRRRRLLVVAVLLGAAASVAGAAEWGLIRPGVSTMESVRAQYGAPTRALREKVEGHETESWIYEGAKAPAGMVRLAVEFGLVQSDTFRREVVRALRLEPKPGAFTRGVVSNGWGFPDLLGREGEEDFFLYKDGLLVYFDKEGWHARLMVFTLPQPRDPTEEKR